MTALCAKLSGTLICRSDSEDPILDACLLHCINHCSKTAELIKKSNQQAKTDPDFEPPRDQGFTRPKVQITSCDSCQITMAFC